MIILAIPLCLIYFSAGLFALLVDKRRKKSSDSDAGVTPIAKPEEI
jgi:Sec-independent protein secretion pathway component TatC